MVFSSLVFVSFFLPTVLAVYYLAGRELRNVVLLGASIIFYAWGDFRYLGILLSIVLLNYIGAICIESTGGGLCAECN